MKINSTQLSFAAACSLAALLAACGGGGGSGATASVGTGSGTLSVAMTDAPACGFDAVNVTVSKVRVHQSSTASDTDSGWTDITLNPARKINLVDLTNGVMTSLGQTPLTAGHYTQLRLVLAANGGTTPLANSVVPTGGSEVALETPSATQSGIKLIHEFDVAANGTADLTLDFDACKSVVTRGNGSYSLKPVVTVIPMQTSGGITGYVDTTLATSKPVVTAQQNGVVIKSTVPDANGAFKLAPLTAGSYAVVVTADAHATDVITAVPVTTSGSTAVSTSAAPLTLPTSVFATASGTVLPLAAAGSVRALQTVGTGTTVTIKYQGADLATGAYSLALPAAAPLLGQFGTLPIALSAQSAAAGKYSVEASASGYQTQTAAVDVTTANAVKNFTLVP